MRFGERLTIMTTEVRINHILSTRCWSLWCNSAGMVHPEVNSLRVHCSSWWSRILVTIPKFQQQTEFDSWVALNTSYCNLDGVPVWRPCCVSDHNVCCTFRTAYLQKLLWVQAVSLEETLVWSYCKKNKPECQWSEIQGRWSRKGRVLCVAFSILINSDWTVWTAASSGFFFSGSPMAVKFCLFETPERLRGLQIVTTADIKTQKLWAGSERYIFFTKEMQTN